MLSTYDSSGKPRVRHPTTRSSNSPTRGTQRAIATQLDLAPKTVRKYLHASACPLPQPRPPRRKLLDRYRPYLFKRLEEGCYNAAQLFRELKGQGFRGKPTIVRDFVT